jgi:hypothetical protein
MANTIITRQTHKTKIYGKDADGNDTQDWVEIERTDKMIIERGGGPDYQKITYVFEWPKDGDGNDDEMADGTRKREVKTLVNPDGPGSIDINVVKMLEIESGQGPDYQKYKFYIENHDDNNKRKTKTKTVTGKDGTSKIDVEQITNFFTEYGGGPDWQLTEWVPEWPMNEDS